ncbi:MFS transporter [Clostridium neuense]|uniref:MFS transporter n=1 Tax=Clostridium neuense TaxID=1728934 RepID=A0ABW8TF76_9CLOT
MEDKILLKEKLAYSAGDVGCNFIYALVSSFLMIYYTNNVKLGAAAVGTLILIARLLDGVTDLTMGAIIDKTNTRWGKTRPWILFSAPLMCIGLILLFNVPMGFSQNGKLIYAYITYIFLMSIIYTIANLSYCTLLSRISDNIQERSVLSSIRFFFVIILTITLSMITNPLVEKYGWTKISIIYGILAFICLFITFAFTKERCNNDKQEKMELKKGFASLAKNKYFFFLAIMFVITYTDLGVYSGSMLYYTTYVIHDANLMGMLTLSFYGPMVIVFVFLPKLISMFGKWKIMMVGLLLKLIGSIIMALDPSSFQFAVAGSIVKGAGMAPILVGIFAIVADVVDYGEWKTGIRVDGLINSCVSFGMKLGGGIGTAILGWILAWGKYNGSAKVQVESALTSIKISFVYSGIVLAIAALVVMYFINIDKVAGKMKSELNAKTISD